MGTDLNLLKKWAAINSYTENISGLKRMGSVANRYRNTKPNFDDSLVLISAGLWNLHLRLVR